MHLQNNLKKNVKKKAKSVWFSYYTDQMDIGLYFLKHFWSYQYSISYHK